jgi:hypothetical protein
VKTAQRILAVTVFAIVGVTLVACTDNTNLVEGKRDQSVNAKSVMYLKQIGVGLLMYADDNNDKLPDLSDAQSLKKAIWDYIKDEKVFIQPKTGKPYQPNPSLSGKDGKGTNIANAVLVYEATPAEDGTRAVLFGDAHVERVTETRWLELKKTSHIPDPNPISATTSSHCHSDRAGHFDSTSIRAYV